MLPRRRKLALARRVLCEPDARFKSRVLMDFVDQIRSTLKITISLAPQTVAKFVKRKEKVHLGVAKCGASKRVVLVPRKKVRSMVMKQGQTQLPLYHYEVRFTLPADVVKSWQGNGGRSAVVLSSNEQRGKSNNSYSTNRWKKSERMRKWELQKKRMAKAQSDIDALD